MCEICNGLTFSCPVCGRSEEETQMIQKCAHCGFHYESETMADHHGDLLCPDCLEKQKAVEAAEDKKFKRMYGVNYSDLFKCLIPLPI